MTANPNTLKYIQQGVDTLVEAGTFRNGMAFRPTQRDAITAYHDYLNNPDITPEEKLKGFFEIPTGVGKTAMFLAVLDEARRAAEATDDSLRAMIVVPTLPIMEQMEEEVREWAPDFLDSLGHYGGKHRNHQNDLTIITYNSWVKLMEEGEIDSSNIDILISDEAHRGTSERRLSNMFNAFAKGTVQIAFTATARFDDEKSVEQSHGRQIFSRGVGEAVRLGELAAYIQTQLYMIRVQPLSDAFTWEGGDPAAIRAGMRQEAWIKQMVAVWRDGRDEHTGDPLTDNKSGFYVFGTEMADRFAKLASADPDLQKRAAEQGCKRVIAAVHSKMSEKQQGKILEAFKRGEILGLVSDEKLKEGFNFPAMKNVFDYQRASLVDKAQIIGRAARQWWNPLKERNEGATIIDSIVYVGSNDPEEDKNFRNAAIRNAIIAWSVLEGTAVFTPKEEFGGRVSDAPRKSGGGGSMQPILGVDVTSYLDLEDLQAIYAEKKHLQGENRIDITEDFIERLKIEIHRTGLGPRALLSGRTDIPEGLADYTVASWINGEIYTAEIEHIDYIENLYQRTPDNQRIPVTDEYLKFLEDSIERTGLGAVALLKNRDDIPNEFSHRTITAWLLRTARTAVSTHLDYVRNLFEQTPDSQRVDFDSTFLELLKNEADRTGLGPFAILKDRDDLPEGMNSATINGWLTDRKRRTVEKDHMDYVIRIYAETPNNKRVELDDVFVKFLRDELERTGLGPIALLKGRTDIPEGLKDHHVGNWSNERIKSAPKNHIDYITGLYAKTPTKTRILITSEIIRHFEDEAKRTGTASRAILKNRNDLPEGMNENTIFYWVRRQVASMEVSHFNFAKKIYSDLPTDEKIPLERDFIITLRREGIRTGLGPIALMKDRSDVPEGLKDKIVMSWLGGTARTARTSHIKYVTDLYASTPDSSRKPVTKELAIWIEQQIARTGINPETLLKNCENPPVGLSSGMIKRWCALEVDTAEGAHIDFLKGKYTALPDIKSKGTKLQQNPPPKPSGMGS